MAPKPYAQLSGAAMKVLIVDDDPITTRILARFLRQHGYEAVESNSSLDAVDRVSRNGFQVALIDWELPGTLNGVDIGKVIRRQGVGTFLMSGHPMSEMRANWRDPLEGFLQFFEKPLDMQQLLIRLEVVRRSVEGTKP